MHIKPYKIHCLPVMWSSLKLPAGPPLTAAKHLSSFSILSHFPLISAPSSLLLSLFGAVMKR